MHVGSSSQAGRAGEEKFEWWEGPAQVSLLCVSVCADMGVSVCVCECGVGVGVSVCVGVSVYVYVCVGASASVSVSASSGALGAFFFLACPSHFFSQ